jgi:hypothetical protein
MAESLTKERSDDLENQLKANIKPIAPIEINGGPPPMLERSSKFGSRESFLQKALESFSKIEGPVFLADFFGGICSHITFRSNDGKIYSWFECIVGEGYSIDNVRFHGTFKSEMPFLEEN